MYLERGVVKIVPLATPVPGTERFVEAAVGPDAMGVIAGAEWQPVEVDGSGFRFGRAREHAYHLQVKATVRRRMPTGTKVPTCQSRAAQSLGMGYDRELADRIRELLGGEPGITEQRMFGGLAFLINGNMAVAASGQGGLLVGWTLSRPSR